MVFKRIGKSVIRVSPTTGNSIRQDLPIGTVWPKLKDKTKLLTKVATNY